MLKICLVLLNPSLSMVMNIMLIKKHVYCSILEIAASFWRSFFTYHFHMIIKFQ